MHSIKHLSFLFSCLLLSVTLSACGSKGDLYQVTEPESDQQGTIKESQEKNTDTIKKPQ